MRDTIYLALFAFCSLGALVLICLAVVLLSPFLFIMYVVAKASGAKVPTTSWQWKCVKRHTSE